MVILPPYWSRMRLWIGFCGIGIGCDGRRPGGRLAVAALVTALAACGPATAEEAAVLPHVQRIIGKPERVEFNIEALVAAGELGPLIDPIVSSLKFAEGAAWSPDGYLVVSDIPADTLYRWEPVSGLATFRQPSRNANGNLFLADGTLLTCEHDTRRISATSPDGEYRVLVDNYRGRRFNSPNDLCLDSNGALWFTDPDYGLRGREREIDGNFVYRYEMDSGRLDVVARDFERPNGIGFSPDGRLLYIADSGAPRHVRVFEVVDGRELTNGRVFATIDAGVPDGLCTDTRGNLYVATGEGVRIFRPNGELLIRIRLPKAGSNVCFGGVDGNTLFITARNMVYQLSMPPVMTGEREPDAES